MGYQVLVVFASCAFALFIAACASAGGTDSPAAAQGGGGALTVTSSAFTDGGQIPKKYSCQGDKTSPELKWAGAPGGAKSYALIVEDPDAPGRTFIHWVGYDIPSSQTEVAEGAGKVGVSGKNGAGQPGYTPPCPPSGSHRYIFNVYALDVATLGLPEGAIRDQVVGAMQGHILAQGKLTGRYEKQ